jgi:CTP synthase (UTP-ammonia lyase)
VLGIDDAEHEETAPHASRLVISKLTCSLAGTTQAVKVVPGTLAHQAYGKESAVEQFRCSYGINPEYRDAIEGGALKVAGVGPDEEVRIVELSGHRFFVATLFLPQLSSSAETPHPLIVAYLKAVLSFRAECFEQSEKHAVEESLAYAEGFKEQGRDSSTRSRRTTPSARSK